MNIIRQLHSMARLRFLDKIKTVIMINNGNPPLFIGRKNRQGFAALTSVLVLGGVALVSSLTASMLFLYESNETEKRSSAVQARTSAYSCANIAMLRLRQNRSYNGNENISVDNVVCSIEGVVADGAARTAYAQATVNGLTSRIKVEIQDVDYFYLNSWTEIPPL